MVLNWKAHRKGIPGIFDSLCHRPNFILQEFLKSTVHEGSSWLENVKTAKFPGTVWLLYQYSCNRNTFCFKFELPRVQPWVHSLPMKSRERLARDVTALPSQMQILFMMSHTARHNMAAPTTVFSRAAVGNFSQTRLDHTVSNHDLLAQCQKEDMETIITRKPWQWIGHVLHKDANSITKVAIHWTPARKRKCGQPKIT